MEDIDLNKPVDVERMSSHEFYLQEQRVRDVVSTLALQDKKPIDRMMVTSHAKSYTDASVHVRACSSFVKEFKPFIPQEALQALIKTARRSYDSVRKDWLMALTKVRDGVAPAESFYTYTVPGMSEKEHTAYKKVLRENKNKAPPTHQTGAFPKRGRGRGGFQNSRGGGRGRGGYSSGGGYDGFDPYDNQGETLMALTTQTDEMEQYGNALEETNNQLRFALARLHTQNLMMSRKIEALKTEVYSLLSYIYRCSALTPAQSQYLPFNRCFVAGRPQHGGTGGYGGGGGGRGGYKGNNFRGGHNGGGGGGGGYGGNQTAGGAAN